MNEMARVKITKKDLKEDQIRNFGNKAYAYIKENQKRITIGLAIVCVILIGFKLYSVQRKSRIQESNILFSRQQTCSKWDFLQKTRNNA